MMYIFVELRMSFMDGENLGFYLGWCFGQVEYESVDY